MVVEMDTTRQEGANPGIRELGVVTYVRPSKTDVGGVVLRVRLNAKALRAFSERGPGALQELLGLRVMLARQGQQGGH